MFTQYSTVPQNKIGPKNNDYMIKIIVSKNKTK